MTAPKRSGRSFARVFGPIPIDYRSAGVSIEPADRGMKIVPGGCTHRVYEAIRVCVRGIRRCGPRGG